MLFLILKSELVCAVKMLPVCWVFERQLPGVIKFGELFFSWVFFNIVLKKPELQSRYISYVLAKCCTRKPRGSKVIKSKAYKKSLIWRKVSKNLCLICCTYCAWTMFKLHNVKLASLRFDVFFLKFVELIGENASYTIRGMLLKIFNIAQNFQYRSKFSNYYQSCFAR